MYNVICARYNVICARYLFLYFEDSVWCLLVCVVCVSDRRTENKVILILFGGGRYCKNIRKIPENSKYA